MKIAMLLSRINQAKILNQKTIRLFSEQAEISWNETDENDPETIQKVIKDADVAVTSWGTPKLTEDILNEAPNLKLILHAAGSIKTFITDAVYARDIRVVSSAKILSYGVSETALGFTISAAKNFYYLNSLTHSGAWEPVGVTDLFDITIGIVGFGYAGRHYAELLQNFEVNIIVFDPGVSAEEITSVGAKKVEIEDVFAQSDIISIHAPELPSTYHMINAENIAAMKDGAILINTARGSLVDEKALSDALSKGKLKCACIDVTDPEPPIVSSPLRKLSNCILTPHIAGQANNGLKRIGLHCYRQMIRYQNGEDMEGEVTKDMLTIIA